MSELLMKEMWVMEKHVLLWKVKNFREIRHSQQALNAQRFYFKMGGGINLPTDWYIRLHTTEKDTDGILRKRKWVGMYIGKKPDEAKGVIITFQFKIKNENGKGFYFESELSGAKNMGIKNAMDSGFQIISSSTRSSKLPIRKDGSLVFEISVNLYSPNPTTCTIPNQDLQTFHSNAVNKLQCDMATMLLDTWSCPSADSPTKIVCKDGVELGVHRGILSARSPVFLRMFQGDMTEAKTGVVEVKEISSMSMKILLHFLYTGVLQDNWSSPGIVEELLYAAGKYEQDEIVKFLDPMLITVCTEENVGKLMNLATKLNMEKAEKDLFQFISDHGITYEKLKGMMKDAIISDWYMVPLPMADDLASGGD